MRYSIQGIPHGQMKVVVEQSAIHPGIQNHVVDVEERQFRAHAGEAITRFDRAPLQI